MTIQETAPPKRSCGGLWCILLAVLIIMASSSWVLHHYSPFPTFPSKQTAVWGIVRSLATASRPSYKGSLGADRNSSHGSFDSRNPLEKLQKLLGNSSQGSFGLLDSNFHYPHAKPVLNVSVEPGANASRHARPAGVVLTGASRVDLPPNTAALCSLSGPDHWLVCRAAIWEKLGWGNMTCPDACVTFLPYGRWNNNLIQLSNTVVSFLDPVMIGAASRRSVVLDGFWKKRFGNIIDVKYLEKICVFPSWGRGARNLAKCKRLDGAVAFKGGSLPKKKETSLLPVKTLIISWVFLGAVSDTARAQVDAQIANLGNDFSAMHARFLEGECASRHQRNNWSSAICTLKPGYVPTQMKILGHSKQAFVVNPRPKP